MYNVLLFKFRQSFVDFSQFGIRQFVWRILLDLPQRHVSREVDLITAHNLRQIFYEHLVRGFVVQQITDRGFIRAKCGSTCGGGWRSLRNRLCERGLDHQV